MADKAGTGVSVPCGRFIRNRRQGFPTATRRSAVFIQRANIAAFNIVEPAVQTQRAIAQAHGNRRVGFDVVQLGDDVSPHHSVDFIGLVGPGFLLTTAFAASE